MPIVEYPIIGFQPDLPPNTPGVITASSQVLPTTIGFGNGYGITAVSTTIATSAAFGGAELFNIAGTSRPFIGCSTKIWELVGDTTTTDRSGSVYNASASQTWSFAQFGNISLAVNKGDTLQQSSAGAAFAAVATAPKASIVVTPGLPNASFVMLFDYNDGVNNYTDGIFWSGLGDYTNWTAAIASQCGNVRLTDTNGGFTAAIPYRNGVLAFKANSMYLGSYVGGADMWDFVRISSEVGCIGKNAVCEVNDVIYFADSYGLWIFDGSYPRLMPGSIHKWWSANEATSPDQYVRLTWDKGKHLIWARYNDDGFGDGQHVAFNTLTETWAQYGSLQNSGGTLILRNLISPSYGAVFNGTSTQFASIQKVSSAASAASMTIGAVGSPYSKTSLRSVRPEWLSGGTDTDTTWCSATVNHGPSLRNVANANTAAATGAPGRFDVLISDNYVQPVITVAAGTSWELQKVAMDVVEGGKE